MRIKQNVQIIHIIRAPTTTDRMAEASKGLFGNVSHEKLWSLLAKITELPEVPNSDWHVRIKLDWSLTHDIH